MMADSDQQISVPLDRSQSPSLLLAIVSDTYTLLLAVALLALVLSLAVLTSRWFGYYGLGPKPVIGQITSVSANQARVDMGSRQGLQPGQRLLALRRGAFLADLSVKAVDDDGSSVVPLDAHGKSPEPGQDGPRIILAKGDTVLFSPSDSACRVLWA